MNLRRRVALWLARLADPDARTATENLREIWSKVKAIDDELNEREVPPDGDDYNDVYCIVSYYARPLDEDAE